MRCSRHLADTSCLCCSRLFPRYDAHTEEALFLRGGEGEGVGGINRAPRPSEEMAEMDQQHPTHSSGYQVEEVRRSGATQEMAERGPHYPSGYPAFTPGNAVRPQPAPAKYAGPAAPFGVQHSIPL